MSWLDLTKGVRPLRKGVRLAVVAGFLSLGVSGCGFHPMYGTSANGGADLVETMKRVQVANIGGRTGQRLRNELLFGTTDGGQQLSPAYRLDVAMRESVRNSLVTGIGSPTGQILQLDAEFRLVRLSDQETVFKGASSSEAAYDLAGVTGIAGSTYGDTRARIDAENRAARMLADTLKTRVAAFLSRPA
jgi:LPS-assembly lipoprotein